MQEADIIALFKQSDALLSGHFILSSGKHSDTYLQCARVLTDARNAEKLCAALAEKVRTLPQGNEIDLVVSPAMGGVIVGYEMARQLGKPGIFCERVDGSFTLRRGFDIPEGAKVLVVEDVVTTGKSSLETFECIRQHGGTVIAEASLVNRSGGEVSLGVPLVSLLNINVPAYDADALPEHLRDVPAVKPGSRWLQAAKAG